MSCCGASNRIPSEVGVLGAVSGTALRLAFVVVDLAGNRADEVNYAEVGAADAAAAALPGGLSAYQVITAYV